MRQPLVTGICAITISLVLGISGQVQRTQAIQTTTPTPASTGDLRVFPGDLVCDKREDTLSNEGPTWMGITVGQSTLTDVERLLLTFSDDYVFVDDDDRDTRFVNFDHLDVTNRSNLVAETPSVVRLCLDEDVVQVLSVTYINYPLPRLYLGDLLVNFGEPDAVTWENDPTGRVVFWFEQGIAVSVSVFPNSPDAYPTFGRVGTEIYFPYQDPTNFEDRWPYNQTRKFNVHMPSPEDPTVDFGPENPFDFEAIAATMTAQPPSTVVPLTLTATSTP